ncbi:MAG: hypothetical protein J6X34_02520, partial [Clostridia bacterium]|nr:hypothetical protein [Clostridia bacterium]
MKKNALKTVSLRLFAAFLAALLMAGAMGIVSAVTGRGGFSTAVLAAEDTYPLNKGSGTGSAGATGPDASVAVQFNVAAAFRSVSLTMNTSGTDKTATMKLYKWDQNVIDSVKGTVVAEKEFSNWSNGDEIVLETSQDAGEYVIELKFKDETSKKAKLSIKCTKQKHSGVVIYENYYNTTANVSPVGSIVLAAAGDDPFKSVSANKNYPYHQAPPDYEYPADSAVVQLGIDPTQWAAVDGLGRTLPGYADVGAKNNKVVGIFYWTWHKGNMQSKAININNLILENPDMLHNYKHKLWAKNTAGSYFWNEPIYGYYTEADDYVLRKHGELLADAGVDFVLFDCTNGDLTWEDAYLNLLKVWGKAREEGVRTPKIGFMMQFWWNDTNTPSSVKQVYNAIYRDGNYQDQ